ncbi:hypothetical protein F5Y14DRAFT_134558 [Nemania sp. NC0429]|nr:hypothetical protein F5Y14DRAFT_134558 [Nemania sp. NC0429]
MPPLSPTGTAAPTRWRRILSTYPKRLRPPPRHPTPIFEGIATLRPRALVGANTVPQGYGNAPFGPNPGTVVGIVLGSVAGFLLLLALFYWCINLGQGPRMLEEGSVGGTSMVSWRRASGPPRKHARHSKRASRREKIEIRRERPVPVRVEREDQIVVEEFQSRSRSRSRSRPRVSTQRPPPQRSVLSDGEDMIVVEEDPPSPRRRRDSMRSQRTRRSDDRRGSFREEVYIRDVSRPRSRSRT